VKVTKEKIENSQAYLTVEMEPAEMEEALEASYRRLAKKTNVPGFRKGKAPRSVLENYIGRESILEEALRHMVPQAYEEALKEQEVEPYAQPEIEITQTDPVIFKAVVPLRPAVTLGDYHSIRMEAEKVEVTEENINAVLEDLRHQNATWEPVERPLDYGDMATTDVDSEIDGLPFIKRLGTQYQIIKGSDWPVFGFSEQVVGMNKDEEREFKITLPEDFAQAEMAGKEASFKVKIGEIKEEKLPEMGDELVKQISTELKDVAALREEVSKTLKQRGEERSRMQFEENMVNAVVEQAQTDFPPVLVEMEIDRILSEQERQLQRGGRGLEEYLASIGKTAEQLREELRSVATKNVTASLVLGELAQQEKVAVEDAEIDAQIDGMAVNPAGEKLEDLRKLFDTPQTRSSIRQSMMMRKTIGLLADIARGEKAEGKEATETEVKEGEK
jgi:trigger factor